jgi:hypothetical protein
MSERSRAERTPLQVLADFCELAEVCEQDEAHARAFDFMLDACVSVLRQDGKLEHLCSAALRIAVACEIAVAREGGAHA